MEQEGPEHSAFHAFVAELRDDLNPAISEAEAIEMLAQHLITKPVFDALFKTSDFTQKNPVSRAMETVLGQLHQHNLAKESESLARFYDSVQRRAADVVTAHGRQELILKLYDSFFKNAFPMLTQRLGIVYTPVEVVDFILHSVSDVLTAQFGQTLGSRGVHILDPFTGTGTFITRLMQLPLISQQELEYKYKNEIHANEIVLLAYYIAAVNIETAYHERAQGKLSHEVPYEPFKGIALTDTFQMYEQERDMIAELLPDNSERRARQKSLDIRVIVGNPPYSARQKRENDNAANITYPQLDAKIRDTYATHSTATRKADLYDSYVRAIRWASDRIGDAGIMAFVSGSSWIEGSFADGMRKCLAEEFSDLYVFHLRGNIRKNRLSKVDAHEGENVFGSSSMAGISVAVFVKNPNSAEKGRIHFHDIGSDLKKDEKLSIIHNFGSVHGITKSKGWNSITPDKNNDWVDQVNPGFDRFLPMGAKKTRGVKIFENYSLGVATSRDSWVCNSNRAKVAANMSRMIDFYNAEVDRYEAAGKPADINGFVSNDDKKINWTANLKDDLGRSKPLEFSKDAIRTALYRPFQTQWIYFDRRLNERVYQMPRIFPSFSSQNLVIQASGVGSRARFSVLMSNTLVNLNTVDVGQCFPLYLYAETNAIFNAGSAQVSPTHRHAITNEGLAHFQAAYPGQDINKEDLFYYIYGLLHAPDYHERFKNNLAKQLPRIPAVKSFDDFAAFRDAGRALGDLHVNFESVQPYMVSFKEGDHRLIPEAQNNPAAFYRVTHKTKWKWGKQKNQEDRSTVIYNDNITLQNIPLEAYDYIVNGRPALEWVMERQTVKTDKKSGIVNDANDYALETIGNPRYPLELFQRVITVSLETRRIVKSLPTLDID